MLNHSMRYIPILVPTVEQHDTYTKIFMQPIYDQDRNAQFAFQNFDREIIAVKEDLSNYLYNNASQLLSQATQKWDAVLYR